MSDRKCPPLFAGIIGFVFGALAVKLAARFCPFCRICCCSDEAGSCCGGDGSAEECRCCGEPAESPSGGETEGPAE